jgi:hypothetical protein
MKSLHFQSIYGFSPDSKQMVHPQIKYWRSPVFRRIVAFLIRDSHFRENDCNATDPIGTREEYLQSKETPNWGKSPAGKHAFFNQSISQQRFSRDESRGLNFASDSHGDPAQPSSAGCREIGSPSRLGGQRARPATIFGVDDNPASLSGAKAGQLLSTVSQEVWQGEGRSFKLLSSGARRTAGGNDLRSGHIDRRFGWKR